MSDVIHALEAQLGKLAAKVERHEKALESARSEYADVETAIRVLRNLAGNAPANQGGSATPTISQRQLNILACLADGQGAAEAPAGIHAAYGLAFDDVTPDTFRTTLWRMKGKVFQFEGHNWIVQAAEGHYWKEKQKSPPIASEGSEEFGRVAELEGPEKTEQAPQSYGENVGSNPTPPSHSSQPGINPWADDNDDDIPF